MEQAETATEVQVIPPNRRIDGKKIERQKNKIGSLGTCGLSAVVFFCRFIFLPCSSRSE
jgi:hypothetical protein